MCPRHVVVVPQPPRGPHPEPRLETPRPRLWLFVVLVGGQGARYGTPGRSFHLFTRAIFIVGIFLQIFQFSQEKCFLFQPVGEAVSVCLLRQQMVFLLRHPELSIYK